MGLLKSHALALFIGRHHLQWNRNTAHQNFMNISRGGKLFLEICLIYSVRNTFLTLSKLTAASARWDILEEGNIPEAPANKSLKNVAHCGSKIFAIWLPASLDTLSRVWESHILATTSKTDSLASLSQDLDQWTIHNPGEFCCLSSFALGRINFHRKKNFF